MTVIYRVFKLIAIALCCVFVATGSQASVCFVPNGDCGGDTVFGNTDNLDDALDKRCQEAGYDKTVCSAGDIKYQCPYKSTQLMCCDKKYHYEGCIYPLEIDNPNGKCGTRYACRCPEEYGVSSAYAEEKNCQPGGGYCMANDGTTDTIKYKTCTCDKAVYTDEGTKCTNNQTTLSTCTDNDGKVHRQCYCDRSEAKFKYASCEYGHKGEKCIDSVSQREYYHECKTATDKCMEEGFTVTNASQCPSGSTACTSTVSGQKYYCALGDGCPYPTSPQLYQCQFDKGRWCKANGYTQESSTPIVKNSACTDVETGLPGQAEPCSENTDTPTYYYRCKISCDQRVIYQASKTGLTADDRFGDMKDSKGADYKNAFYVKLDSPKNGFHAGYHLFLRGNFRMPDTGLSYDTKSSGDKKVYAAKTSTFGMYHSINGIAALYQLDPNVYADCQEDYENVKNRPTFTIPKSYANDILSRGFTNINVTLSESNEKGELQSWYGKKFTVNRETGKTLTTWVWKNVNLTSEYTSTSGGETKTSSDVGYSSNRTLIYQATNTKIRFSGKTRIYSDTVTRLNGTNPVYYPNSVDGDAPQSFGTLTFHGDGYHILEFKDATMSNTYSCPDIDASDSGAVLNIDNSTVCATNIFSYVNVNVNNRSSLTAKAINAAGLHKNYTQNTTGMEAKGTQYCVGVVARNNSTIKITEALMEIYQDRYLYAGGGSKIISSKPIRFKSAGRSVGCISGSNSSIKAYGEEYTIANGDYTKNWIMHPHNLNKNHNTGRIIYSTKDASCMPYTINQSYTSGQYSPRDSLYKKHCTGRYNRNGEIFTKENSWSGDPTTHATPAYITFDGVTHGNTIATYSATPSATIKSWYPRMNSGYECTNCSGNNSCKSRGASYTNPNSGLCGDWVKGAESEDAGPRLIGSRIDYYYYRCSTNQNDCYGCSGNHQYICSGCSRCANGIAYKDWSDTTGGM